MQKITKLEDIEIYQESLRLVKDIFDLCKIPLLGKEFSLCDQLKRASISACANIAEGFGRRTKADFTQFLSISLGSTNEVIALLDVVKVNFSGLNVAHIKESYIILSKRIYTFRRHLIG